jgi:hypothetical protein
LRGRAPFERARTPFERARPFWKGMFNFDHWVRKGRTPFERALTRNERTFIALPTITVDRIHNLQIPAHPPSESASIVVLIKVARR